MLHIQVFSTSGKYTVELCNWYNVTYTSIQCIWEVYNVYAKDTMLIIQVFSAYTEVYSVDAKVTWYNVTYT